MTNDMKQENDMITMLGTGNALATRCYNTCFTLHVNSGILLVDTGRNILRLPWASRNSKHKGTGLSRTTTVKRLTARNPME